VIKLSQPRPQINSRAFPAFLQHGIRVKGRIPLVRHHIVDMIGEHDVQMVVCGNHIDALGTFETSGDVRYGDAMG
jgi:hypothetical protein